MIITIFASILLAFFMGWKMYLGFGLVAACILMLKDHSRIEEKLRIEQLKLGMVERSRTTELAILFGAFIFFWPMVLFNSIFEDVMVLLGYKEKIVYIPNEDLLAMRNILVNDDDFKSMSKLQQLGFIKENYSNKIAVCTVINKPQKYLVVGFFSGTMATLTKDWLDKTIGKEYDFNKISITEQGSILQIDGNKLTSENIKAVSL